MEDNQQLFWLTDKNATNPTINSGLGQKNGAPLALPTKVSTAADAANINISQVSTINIIKNFNWTNSDRSRRELALSEASVALGTSANSPLAATAGIPAIMLNEYRVTFSSALANMRYQIGALFDSKAIIDQGMGMVTGEGSIGGAVGGKQIKKVLTGDNGDGGVIGTVFRGAKGMTNALEKGVFGSTFSKFDPAGQFEGKGSMVNNPHLKPYAGMYLGQPSGFRYVFPWLTSQQYRTATNGWANKGNEALQELTGQIAGAVETMGAAAGAGLGAISNVADLASSYAGKYGKALDVVSDVAGGAGQAAAATGSMAAKVIMAPLELLGKATDFSHAAANVVTPGSSLEQILTYDGYGKANQPIQIQFYLSNSHSYEEVVKNWHLLFLLHYQNLPNKNNKVSLEPPVMYEVIIPGHYYSPFSYIQNISIAGMGNTRVMEIPLNVKRSGAGVEVSQYVPTSRKTVGFSKGPVSKGTHATAAASLVKQSARSKTATGNVAGLPMNINVPIPEAYVVTISMTSMVPDAKNFLYHTLKNDNTLYSATLDNMDPQNPEAIAQRKVMLQKGVEVKK